MTNAQDSTQIIDYFKLPFEVHYSEAVPVTQYEFKSDPDENTGRFSDVKAVHMEQGSSFGLVLVCQQNNGPELYCCITNSHDEVSPEWLSFVSESEMDFNYGTDYAVTVEGDEITFSSALDDSVDIDSLDYSCTYAFNAYHIAEASPEYIVLDAENSRIKVGMDGYILDEEGIETATRIFDPLLLEEDEEKYENYTRLDLWEAKFDWIKSTLEVDFPEDKHLKLSFDTE